MQKVCKLSINENVRKSDFLGRLQRDLKRNKALYILAIPMIVYYVVFCYLPMYGLVISFQNYNPAAGFLGSTWVGFRHYIDFFTNEYFGRLIKNTVTISLTSLIFGFPAPILFTLMLNEFRNKYFKGIVKTVSYMPHFISLVVVVGLIKSFVSPDGLIGNIYAKITGNELSMLMNPKMFVPIYVASNIWQGMGWDSIIYFSALTSIDMQLYEAARIDGAGKFKQALHVTLPGIVPTIVTMFILRMGSILSVGYEKIILLYNEYTYQTADVISTYVYRKGLQEFNWSYSTAVGMFNSVINVCFMLITNRISRKVSDISLW